MAAPPLFPKTRVQIVAMIHAGALPGTPGSSAPLDANLSAGVVETLADGCRRADVPYALDPSAHERCTRIAAAIPGCDLVKPDRPEAAALTGLRCDTSAEAGTCAEALMLASHAAPS